MDEIHLQAQDVFKTSSIGRNCLKVISVKDKLSKVALGDDAGVVVMLNLTGENANTKAKVQFTTKEVSIIELGNQPAGVRDRVFYASGSQLFGLTKKLKEIVKFDTQLADVIKHLVVETTWLFTAGDYLVNQYEMLNDQITHIHYFMSPDKINDMQAHYLSGQNKVNLILACQDSCVRVLDNDKIQYEYAVSAPVVCMAVYSNNYKEISSPWRKDHKKCFAFGLENGLIIIADMTMVKAIPIKQIQIDGQVINLIRPCDFFKTGNTDLLIAKNNCVIELYSQQGSEYELRASKRINETVTSIDAGSFKTQNTSEIIIGTFSGRVMLLKSTEDKRHENDKKVLKQQEEKIKSLKSEVQKLEQQYNEQKLKSEKDTQSVQYAQAYKLNSKVIKSSDDGAYNWIIECQFAIEIITIQSGMKLEIMNDDQDLVVSLTETSSSTQVCLRSKSISRKTLDIKFRTKEGDSGILTAYVIPDVSPKSVQTLSIEIKALSLHSRVSEEIPLKSLALNTLTLKGSFTKNYMNMWINNLVPDFPNNSEEDLISLTFKNVLTNTYLQIKYKQGQASIKSDSINTIAICRKFICEQANSRGIQLDVKWEVNDDSIKKLIETVIGKLREHQRIEQSIKIIPALKELKSTESDLSFLSADFRETLEREQELVKEHALLPKRLEFLISILVDVYESRQVLKGFKPNPQQSEFLRTQLKEFKFENIIRTILNL